MPAQDVSSALPRAFSALSTISAVPATAGWQSESVIPKARVLWGASSWVWRVTLKGCPKYFCKQSMLLYSACMSSSHSLGDDSVPTAKHSGISCFTASFVGDCELGPLTSLQYFQVTGQGHLFQHYQLSILPRHLPVAWRADIFWTKGGRAGAARWLQPMLWTQTCHRQEQRGGPHSKRQRPRCQWKQESGCSR